MRRFRPYLKYLKSVRRPLIAALFYAALYGATSGFGLPMLVQYVFPPIFNHEVPTSTVILIATCIPLSFVLRSLSSFLNSYYIQFTGVHVLEIIRVDYFKKLQALPLSFVQNNATGDLISRGMSDTGQLQATLTTLASDGIKQPIQLVGTIGTLIFLAFKTEGTWLVLATLGSLPLCILPVRYIGKKVIKSAYQLQTDLGSVTSHFTENISAAREVRAFGLEEREVNRFGDACHSLVKGQIKIAKYVQALPPTIEALAATGVSGALVAASASGMPLNTFIAIVTALYLSYEPIKKIGALNNEYKRGLAALDRIEFVLQQSVTIKDPERPVTIGRVRGEVALENVTFAYKENSEPALRDLTIKIPAGTVCALVGPSGAGKTTFINLVPRFYDPTAGRVTIDGIDVRALRLSDLRNNIALVSQDPVLFNDTIYNNLLLGRMNATRTEIEQAAANAYADEFISDMPNGYDTIVGERGVLLSGGQKQRIAIARAFLRGAPLLVLDEATSALDSESEAAIQKALKKLMVGKTVLIIAHRFSTIRDASMILVFSNGQIIGCGNHQELYQTNSVYKMLYDGQAIFGLPVE